MITPEAMQILVPLLSHCHSAFQDSHDPVPLGPYFPRRGHSGPVVVGKGGARPLRPMMQMTVPQNQLECARVRQCLGNTPQGQCFNRLHFSGRGSRI